MDSTYYSQFLLLSYSSRTDSSVPFENKHHMCLSRIRLLPSGTVRLSR